MSRVIYKLDVTMIDRGRRAQFSHTQQTLAEYDKYGDPKLLDEDDKPNFKAIYRYAVKEYGRCVSKMYTDTVDGRTIHIGWVFQKRMAYIDSPKKKFVQETWVSVLEVIPEQRSVMEVD